MTRNYKNDPGILTGLGALAVLIALIAVVVVLAGSIFAFLWNLAVPAMFGLPTIEGFPTGTAAVLLLTFVASAFRRGAK